jgi:hypothetical protein
MLYIILILVYFAMSLLHKENKNNLKRECIV